MNDLFSGSFSRLPSGEPSPHGGDGGGVNLDKFFEDVESVKGELKELDRLSDTLQLCHEQSKMIRDANAVKDLRSKMDGDVAAALRKAKTIKLKLESLDRANAANRSKPGCGPGSSADRTRISVVNGLRKTLKDSMESFNRLREKVWSEYGEIVERRYFTVTGENPDEETLDRLISTGESERLLQKAIQEQGSGRILDTINEIQERHEAVKEIEKNLEELNQVFLGMVVMVEHQGSGLDNIESHVAHASSFVRAGTEQLDTAKMYQKNTRKWTFFTIIIVVLLIIIIIVAVVLAVVKPWQNNGGGGIEPITSTTTFDSGANSSMAQARRLLR
ncbi:PREDICTED: syntaxin-121-like [Tarenaya hassleriana]|uniref:syntaxin-121-like n=1 Tax=Tarenaya hassleriana TaxID=28532 RepID=UPI00053C5DBC|nr:PREDICTED: syntaxin-121-like [Tarenaya hassleriana]